MPRAAATIELDTKQREELEARARARSGEQRVVERARIVLLEAQGWSNNEVAQHLSVDADTVRKW